MRVPVNKSAKLICRIDMAGFLSIQVVLLSIFIFRALDHPDLPNNTAELPKAVHSVAMRRANREDAMIVAIQRDGRLWLGSDRVSPDDLQTRIRQAISHGAESKTYIRADARATYGHVLQAVAAVRSAGVENIAFLVDERK